MAEVPEGFSTTLPTAAAPLPSGDTQAPVGFSLSPPPTAQVPAGFSETPPPQGFSFDNPAGAPDTTTPQMPSNPPGFLEAAGSAFKRGLIQRAADDVAGVRVMLPKGFGGQTLDEQVEEGKLHPETQDAIQTLLGQKVNQGWTDPKWWVTQIANATGSMVPALGASVVGGAFGVPPAVTFGIEGALGTLVPAYKKAIAENLPPDAALNRALVDSEISGATGVAMGLAPNIAIFGKTPAGQEVVTQALRRPAMEALTQLGVIQPALSTGGHAATTLSHEETLDPWDLATDWVVGTGMGVVPVGAHTTMRVMAGAPKAVQAPATPEDIATSHANQAAPPGFSAAPPEVGSAPPSDLTALETGPKTREAAIFYSPVRQAIEAKLPDNASVEQVLGTLKNAPGVKEEELLDLGLPSYLASVDGKVNKKDLLAHVESEAVHLEEVVAQEPEVIRQARILAEAENGSGSWNRIGGGGQAHYLNAARRTIQLAYRDVLYPLENLYGYDTSRWPQEARDQVAAARKIADDKLLGGRAPEYTSQVAPGEHANYREFVMKVPPRGEPAPLDLDPNIPRGWQDTGNAEPRYPEGENYQSSHWPDLNVVSHFRTTDRVDRDGRKLLHVEEIQSDMHQEGRKSGYLEKGEPKLSTSEIESLSRRVDTAYKKMKDFEDDWDAKHGYSDDTYRHDPGYLQLRRVHDDLQARWEAAHTQRNKVPDFPFKTGWQELTVKRILRLAADEGYDGISWANGDQIGLRQTSVEQLRGSREFYDKLIPSRFKYWAKKLGMEAGTTKLEGASPDIAEHLTNLTGMGRDIRSRHFAAMGLEKINDRNGYIEVNPAASNRIRMGLPLYETEPAPKGGLKLNQAVQKGLPTMLTQKSIPIMQAFHAIAKDMKISAPVDFQVGIQAGPKWQGMRGQADKKNGRYQITINTAKLRTTADVYATIGHELGHVVMWDKFANAPAEIKTQIFEAFRRFRQQMVDTARTVGDIRRVRDNAISEMTGARNLPDAQFGRQDQIPLSDLDPRSRSYMLHFEEWFAEQTAKWATTSTKPLSRLDKFFAALGRRIKSIVQAFRGQRPGDDAQAVPAMQGWLDSMISDMAPFAADIKDQHEFDTKRQNQDAIDRDGTPQVAAGPATASTVGGRSILDGLGPLASGAGKAMAAHADRMNRFYEWMTSLPQIAEMNKHIRPLQIYKEVVSLMNLEKNNIMGDAWQTLRSWKQLPKEQLTKLNAFIDDYANGLFKDPNDQSGSIRRPNQAEFSALVSKHGLSREGLQMFNKLVRDFDGFLEKYRSLLLADAARIKDPVRQLSAIESANRKVDELLNRPFFPIRHFGKYTVTVYDTNGNVRHFETTHSLRKQGQIAEALGKSVDLLPGDRVRTGEVPKDAAPLLGMPPGLIDLIADKLDLSDSQRLMLDQLRFDYAPSQSFKNQFRQRDLTPGYSTDFQRSYAHFFFHGANHMTRVKWVDSLRDQIKEVKTGSIDINDAVKRDKIGNYLTEHLKMLVDPKPDFAALRGLMFHWYLGFNPASATLNLSQTPIMTYPHLASKFGDLKAVASLAKAGLDLNNFYKKGTIQDLAKNAAAGPAGSKLRALSEAVEEGVISETQAHTLAAVSEDRNLLRAFGSKGEEAWQRFSEASSWMFEMTEQYNRRVAFRSAWELAMRDPNNKYVLETVRDNPLQYKRLRDLGWSHQEAAAFTAAKDSVQRTQFVYAPYARPKFMWGRKGALFIFKSFIQNSLWNIWSNKQAGARSLLILGALGGLMGLPGTEDVNGLLKALAWHLFGKDFDLEDEARKFAVDVLDGKIGPDVLLHGMSVHGFGIPHVMNALGAHVGLEKWFPTLDRHGSISMGNILPIEPGKLFGPTKDAKTQELGQLQRASGAGFSNVFALYNFLNSQDSLSDLKRWEQIMPRAMSNLSHGWRYLREGQERSGSGAAVVKFDPHDTEQMAEVLARSLGYQPRRLTAAWEAMGAKQEAATYWDLRRGILFRQFAAALREKDPESKERVLSAIRSYNAELPQEAKGKAITSQALRDSMQDRMRAKAKTEAGLPAAKADVAISRSMDKYYPEGRPTGLVAVKPVQ